MKFKSLIAAGLVCFALFGATGCEEDKPPASGTEITEKEEDIHYIKLFVDGKVVGQMVVNSGDTFESLLPYFPTLPQEEGYKWEWEKPDGGIYQKDNLIISITATKVKIHD